MSASSDVLTARDSSIGNSGGTTDVRISVHSKNNLYLLRDGFSLPTQFTHTAVYDNNTRISHVYYGHWFSEPTKFRHTALQDKNTRVGFSVPVGLSGNALVSINIVSLHRARLVPGRVTITGRVNHLGTEPGTQVYSAWAIPRWVGASEYPAQAEGVNRHSACCTSLYRTLWAGVWLWDSYTEISADVWEAVAH